jgi:hypothetical protein
MGIIIVVVHGGERVANLFSLTISCDRLKREPDAYLCDIVPRLSSHPEREIWKLTPRGWRNSRALVEAEAADSTGTGGPRPWSASDPCSPTARAAFCATTRAPAGVKESLRGSTPEQASK